MKKKQGRYETLLDMRVNNEIPKEVFSRKQQEVEERIAELEQQMMQYGDVKHATDEDINGKLEGFSIQSLLTWCRILPLNRRIGRREKKKAGIYLVASDIF